MTILKSLFEPPIPIQAFHATTEQITWQSSIHLRENNPQPVIFYLPSKSRTSHRRKEAATKKWLVDDTRSPRPKGGATSGPSSFVRKRFQMGKELERSSEFLWDRQPLPGLRRNGCAMITSRGSISLTSGSEAPVCFATLPEFMNAMFSARWQRRPSAGAAAC